jgi:hypothetical protein
VHAPPRHDSPDASRGTDRHTVLRCKVSGEPFDGPALWGCTPEEWPAVEANIDAWLPKTGTPEQAIYYDVANDSARGESLQGAREYDCRDGEIPLTVDLIKHNGCLEVWEYKTGAQLGLEPVAENGQCMLEGLAVARLTNSDSARVVLALVADDGTCARQDYTFDSLELDDIAAKVRADCAAIPTSEPRPGPWCSDKWCPCRAVCPATTQAITTTPLAPLSIEIVSDEQCAAITTQLALAEEFLETVKRARNAYLEQVGEVALPDGSRLVWAEESRESIEANNNAVAYLVENGLDNAIEHKSTKAAIERAVRAAGGNAERVRQVLYDLHAMGAVKTTTYNKPKIKKARKAA